MRLPQALLLSLLLLWTASAFAVETDNRMMVELHAADVPADQAPNLQSDIPGMAKIAIDKLWDRLVPQPRRADMKDTDAMALLQRAVPTSDGGLMLVFSHDRVAQYLQAQDIVYPATAPHFDLAVHLTNPAGMTMPQSEALLMDYAQQNAAREGYAIDAHGDPLDLSWRWQNSQQVALNVTGNPHLPASQEIRTLAPGDPMPQIQAWMDDVMLKARDAYAAPPAKPAASALPTTPPADEAAGSAPQTLELIVSGTATLAEQVLFEQALTSDPHVAALQLSRVNADSRQYLLHLRQGGEGWLPAWFASHGMQATPTVEGWLAHE
jgi:hypothetical protein